MTEENRSLKEVDGILSESNSQLSFVTLWLFNGHWRGSAYAGNIESSNSYFRKLLQVFSAAIPYSLGAAHKRQSFESMSLVVTTC